MSMHPDTLAGSSSGRLTTRMLLRIDNLKRVACWELIALPSLPSLALLMTYIPVHAIHGLENSTFAM